MYLKNTFKENHPDHDPGNDNENDNEKWFLGFNENECRAAMKEIKENKCKNIRAFQKSVANKKDLSGVKR